MDTTGDVVGVVADGLADSTVPPAEGPVVVSPTYVPGETPCEQRRREWRLVYGATGAKLPPQLRCGPDGEWPDAAPSRTTSP
jgi:hypothetical protein